MRKDFEDALITLSKNLCNYECVAAIQTIRQHVSGLERRAHDAEAVIEGYILTKQIESRKRDLDPMVWLKERVTGLTKTVDDCFKDTSFPQSGAKMVVDATELLELCRVLGIKWTHPERRHPQIFMC